MNLDLFSTIDSGASWTESLCPGAVVLRQYDACLINRYPPGSKMGLHQDKDERDFAAPIVSVSLGVPVTFQFGGMKRTGMVVKIPLTHGDVVVWC